MVILLSTGANPCEHFGKCVNTEGSFQCQCGRGYAGPRCEIDINECLSMPCQNDATCLDRIGEFTCICMPGRKTFQAGLSLSCRSFCRCCCFSSQRKLTQEFFNFVGHTHKNVTFLIMEVIFPFKSPTLVTEITYTSYTPCSGFT